MAIFELEIDDTDVQRVFDAVCGNYRYQALIQNPEYDPESVDENGNPSLPEIANPETRGQFVHRKVREFLSSHVQAWETKQAKLAAIQSVSPDVTISDPNP